MNFNEWIKKETPRVVARRLKVDYATVSYWQSRKNCPRPATMRKITEISKGEVTYEDIINYFLRVRKS